MYLFYAVFIFIPANVQDSLLNGPYFGPAHTGISLFRYDFPVQSNLGLRIGFRIFDIESNTSRNESNRIGPLDIRIVRPPSGGKVNCLRLLSYHLYWKCRLLILDETLSGLP